MNWILILAVAWVVLSLPAAILIGKFIKLADRRDNR